MAKVKDLPRASSLTQPQLNALLATARRLNVNPEELLTIIAYETQGTMSPEVQGGAGGAYTGLIQGGAAAKKDFPLLASSSFEDQLMGAEQYLKAKGGYGSDTLGMYSAINAGYNDPKRYDWSDIPGKTVRTHVADMMSGPYNQQAKGLLAQYVPTEANREEAPAPTFAAREPPDHGTPEVIPATSIGEQPATKLYDDLIKSWQENKIQREKEQGPTSVGQALLGPLFGNVPGEKGYREDKTLAGGVLDWFKDDKEDEKLLADIKDKTNPYAPGSVESQYADAPKKNPGYTLANALFGTEPPKKKKTLLGGVMDFFTT